MPLRLLFSHLQKPVSITPLVTFRILFGLMMLGSTLRFWLKGWITEQYVKPGFYFTYMGFDWVRPLGDTGMHLLFGLLLLTSLTIALGFFYRISIFVFFMAFTYIELIDVTNYLNHYYFISLISFLLLWLPAHRYFSLDVYFRPKLRKRYVPLWTVGILRLQVALVYFFAGIAKLNEPWMLQALPMKIWLPAKSHLPLVGKYMYEAWVAYLFSWFGALYDLLIAFFLNIRKTRLVAYLCVLGFHIATAIFFPVIGMFPYIMMVCSLVFLSSEFHRRLLEYCTKPDNTKEESLGDVCRPSQFKSKLILASIVFYFLFQFLIPLRYLCYPGNLFWVEEGYRFSWRVMLMEKSGIAFFYIKEPTSRRKFEVDNKEYLTPQQDKMMSTQPDMILRYAHYLKEVYVKKGIVNPEVHAECYVALNGERSKLFIDSAVDLSRQQLSFKHYDWVLPYDTHEK